MQSVLVLNASYQPLSIVPAKRAVKLLVNNKATALDGSGRFWKSANGSIEIPYVILLNYIVKQGSIKPAAYSRRGVFVRDNHSCVYCGKKATTIDHVIPRALGGKDSFENCVAACGPCNNKKADKTLAQLGWTVPQKNMKAPSMMVTSLARVSHPETFAAWKTYIGMYETIPLG